jgi:N-acetylglutamate synthase-like GNAT family acetyltransferase
MKEINNTVLSIDFHPLNNPSVFTPTSNYLEDFLYSKIKEFLLESSSIYSNIGNWWDKTVVPGLRTGERVCNYIIEDNELAAVSIGKRSNKSSKLCSLKVNEKYRSRGFGHQLLTRTLSQLIGTGCKRVHFTVSDEIQHQVGSFFEDYGFRLNSWEHDRYSKGHEELIFSANTQCLFQKLPRTHLYFRDIVTSYSPGPQSFNFKKELDVKCEVYQKYVQHFLALMSVSFDFKYSSKPFRFSPSQNNSIKWLWQNHRNIHNHLTNQTTTDQSDFIDNIFLHSSHVDICKPSSPNSVNFTFQA